MNRILKLADELNDSTVFFLLVLIVGELLLIGFELGKL